MKPAFHSARETICQQDPFRDGDGFLYMAEIVGTDAIKIGYSTWPENRLRSFASHIKRKARLFFKTPSKQSDEMALHCRLRPHRHPDFPNAIEIYPRRVLCNAWIPTRVRIRALSALRNAA